MNGKISRLAVAILATVSADIGPRLFGQPTLPANATGAEWRIGTPQEYGGRSDVVEIAGKGALLYRGLTAADITFVSFSVRPQAQPDWEHGTVISVGEVALGYQKSTDPFGNDYGQLVAIYKFPHSP